MFERRMILIIASAATLFIIKLKEIRKLWASYMTKFLSKPEIDLIQGRVRKDVFMELL